MKYERFIRGLRHLLKNTGGQDLIEYALLVSLTTASAGALVPDVADNIRIVFGKVGIVLRSAGGGPSRSTSPTQFTDID